MAKTKVSEWDVVADNNQDISGITLGTGMPPSYVNDSIREMMAQIKDWQSGSSKETLYINGELKLEGSSGTEGQVLVSQGNGEPPKWGNAYIRGMIILWSGSVNNIPSGWILCNGSNGTPDLRNRFVVGAGSTYAVDATGGSANAVVVSHNHTGSTNTTGNHKHTGSASSAGNHRHSQTPTGSSIYGGGAQSGAGANSGNSYTSEAGAHTHGLSLNNAGNHSHSFTTANKGESGTNKNLPPYYALAYIMKL